MIRSIVLSLVCLFALAGTASAQFFLEEGKVVLAVSAGDRINKSLTVHNTTGESVQVKVYWEDFEYQAPYDGNKVFLPAGMGAASASQWFNFSPREFTLPAFGKQVIDYTVSAPQELQGGYYGVLFFEKSNDPLRDGTGVNIVTRVGCLFFFEARDKVKTAAIDGIKISANALSGNFINQGNVVLISKATYYVMDNEGMIADRGEAKALYVPPGATASWEIALPPGLNAGNYTLVLNADLGEGDVVVKEIELMSDGAGGITIGDVRD